VEGGEGRAEEREGAREEGRNEVEQGRKGGRDEGRVRKGGSKRWRPGVRKEEREEAREEEREEAREEEREEAWASSCVVVVCSSSLCMLPRYTDRGGGVKLGLPRGTSHDTEERQRNVT